MQIPRALSMNCQQVDARHWSQFGDGSNLPCLWTRELSDNAVKYFPVKQKFL